MKNDERMVSIKLTHVQAGLFLTALIGAQRNLQDSLNFFLDHNFAVFKDKIENEKKVVNDVIEQLSDYYKSLGYHE